MLQFNNAFSQFFFSLPFIIICGCGSCWTRLKYKNKSTRLNQNQHKELKCCKLWAVEEQAHGEISERKSQSICHFTKYNTKIGWRLESQAQKYILFVCARFKLFLYFSVIGLFLWVFQIKIWVCVCVFNVSFVGYTRTNTNKKIPRT